LPAGATLGLRDGASEGSVRLLQVVERSAVFERVTYEAHAG
jgi:hypothetical protein